MFVLAPKTPAAILAYVLDFAAQLTDDSIKSIQTTVESGGVTIETSSFTFQEVRLLVSGGTDAQDAVISVAITTHGGQVFTDQFQISIRSGANAVVPQTFTKRTIVNMAFEEIGLAGYEFDATPEEQFSALRRLDALMAEWQAQGIVLGYNFPPVIGASDLDDAAGIPDWTLNITVIKLARRIMPAIGKTMSAETRHAETTGWNLLTARTAKIPERLLPRNTPVGAGNKPYSTLYPFARSAGRTAFPIDEA